MPPKNRPAKELLAKGPSPRAGDQNCTTVEATTLTTHIPQRSHPHRSTESHVATADTRRPEGPMGQQPSQIEVFATNIAVADLPPSSSQQQLQYNQDPQLEVEAGDDQHHDSEEEIEALIEDELVHLHQENEHFRLVQEHIIR
jgi:hypothetical protein